MKKNNTAKGLLLFILCLSFLDKSMSQTPTALGCNGFRYLNDIATDTTKTTVQYGENKNALGENQKLFMDIIQPKGDTQSRRPVIILAFGGAFITGNRNDMLPLANIFSKRGYVCMSIDYRLWDVQKLGAPDSTKIMPIVIQALQDMKAAVRWVRRSVQNGNPFKLDSNYVIVGGGSAGAITAMHVAHLDSTDNIPTFLRNIIAKEGGFEGNSGSPGFSSRASAVINLSGGLYRASFIDAGDPPFISYHGTADNIVPYDFGNNVYQFGMDGSASCHRQAQRVGVPSLLYSVPGGGHTNIYEGLFLLDLLNFLNQGSQFMQRRLCGTLSAVTANESARLIKTYPNPSYGSMTIETGSLTEGGAFDVSVFNAVGQQVFYLKNSNQETIQLDKSLIGKGLFILKIKTLDKEVVKKIIFE